MPYKKGFWPSKKQVLRDSRHRRWLLEDAVTLEECSSWKKLASDFFAGHQRVQTRSVRTPGHEDWAQCGVCL